MEDEAIVSMAIRRSLEKLGYEVVGETGTGQGAIDLAKKTVPDLILMDIRLKGEMDGTQAAAKIRERRSIPVVFLTAYSDDETLDRAASTTPYGYVLKPYQDRELRAAVEIALRLAALEGERDAANEALVNKVLSLERVNRDLDSFTAMVSHDLRDPLTIVAGFLQRLADRESVGPSDRARMDLDEARNAIKQAQEIVTGLTMLARMGRAPNAQLVDTGRLVDEVLASLRAPLDAIGAQVGRGSMPSVYADRGQLAQVLQNLLNNAIRCRKPDVPLTIQMHAREMPGEWEFSVSDNGIGFERAAADEIFTLFRRLGHEKHPGSGVELALCRKVIEAHGGRIWAESTTNEGSTFRFTLPRSA